MEKQNLDPEIVDELVYGIVVLDPAVPHIAWEVNFSSKLPSKVRSLTVTNNCITGTSAITSIYDSIVAGRAEVGIAGGVESMANTAALFQPKASRIFLDASSEKTLTGRLKHFLKLRPWDFRPYKT